MKVYVLCLQLGSDRGDWLYEQVFATADAAKEYLVEQHLEWETYSVYGFCTDWFKGYNNDIGARWIILEQEVLK